MLNPSKISVTQARAIRFLGVTVVTAGLGQVLILLLFGGLKWPALVANTVAVSIVAVAGFFLSMRYVWTESDSTNRSAQIGLFLFMSAVGLVLSSITVRIVTQRVDHILAANVGSALGYGIAWMLRFAVLDRVFVRMAQV